MSTLIPPLTSTYEGPALRIPASAGTLRGFRDWAVSEQFPETGRISYIGGELIIDMSPESGSHNAIRTEVARIGSDLCRERDLGRFYGDGMLLTNERAGVSTEPDAMFAAWETLRSGRLHTGQTGKGGEDYKEVRGTPDLVVEIVSRSSIDKDTRLLREAYHRAGIPEYWLIDALGDEVVFQILRHGTAGYEAVGPRGGWRRSTVFDRDFRLDRDRDRLGDWRYTLAVR